MNNGAFVPMGQTYLVGTSSVQVKSQGNQTPTSYRIKAMLTTTQYLRWAPPDPTGTAITVGSVTAPYCRQSQQRYYGILFWCC